MFWKFPMASQPLLCLATAQADPRNLRKQRQQHMATDGLKCAVYFPHLLNVHPMLMDGFQVEREGVLGEPVQHGLHGLARPRTACV